jgi:hypothetical protein
MTFIRDYRQEQKSIMAEKLSKVRTYKVWHKDKQSVYNSQINGHDYCTCDLEGDYIRFEDYVDLLNIFKE